VHNLVEDDAHHAPNGLRCFDVCGTARRCLLGVRRGEFLFMQLFGHTPLVPSRMPKTFQLVVQMKQPVMGICASSCGVFG
jgi:hypothetical protein